MSACAGQTRGGNLILESGLGDHWIRCDPLPDTKDDNHRETDCHRGDDMCRAPGAFISLQYERCRAEKGGVREVLLISTPKDPKEEKRQTTDGEDTPDIINPLQYFEFSKIPGINSGRRPIEQE